MKCSRCGKEIDELEIFCDECKKELRKSSSKSDVKELEKLIENQKKLTDLENTKELGNLDKLTSEEISKEESVKESKKDVVKYISRLDSDFIDIEIKEKRNKKIIIIVSIILSVLILILGLLIFFLGKDKKVEENKVVIDYEKVIKTYGDKITKIVNDYENTNEEIPTWEYILENLDYKRYEVECNIHNIYSDGSIYLSGCKVDDKKIKYTYGKEKKEIKEGKNISIYKEDSDGYLTYSNLESKTSQHVGTITCKTEECSYISAYNNYVLIKENDEYYLYDYMNDSAIFGPLNYEYDLLVNGIDLYGIIYKEGNSNNIYNVKTNKVLENIKGILLSGEMGFDPTIMLKYNYVVLNYENQNNFVNLKTGKISYTIEENIIDFVENTSKKIVYIVTTSNDKYKFYNSTGKTLFKGEEYLDYIISMDRIIISNGINFKIYDNDLKLKKQSKNYDKILGIYDKFVISLKDDSLILLNYEDEEYVKFENSWDDKNYELYKNLTIIKDNKIVITIKNKKIPSGSEGHIIEYYYNLTTKESGYIEKSNID